MIDDTCFNEAPATPHPSFNLAENVDDILQHTVTRAHASYWARNLRFLTFDETVEHSSVTGQCLPCEQRLPPPSGHFCAQHAPYRSSDDDSREKDLRTFSNPCVHVREHSCQECQHIPLFPNHEKVTRFRIRRLLPVSSEGLAARECAHFVAVSYCWTSQEGDGDINSHQDQEPYLVREENGSIRPIRAQRHTIDRIVAFARENGFRMIWIDQECIEQDNPSEKEIAIQAMDYVYLRAQTSIGLFSARLQQQHLDCLLLVYEYQLKGRFRKRRGRSAFQACRKLDLKMIRQAISMIVNDKWNTRAWILQEAFASSGNMVLLFPRKNGIRVNGWMLVCHELSRTDLAIRLDDLQECFRICIPYLWPQMTNELKKKKKEAPKTKDSKTQAGGHETAEDIQTTLRRIQLFHLGRPENDRHISINRAKPRRTCNAAVALTFLRTRDLFRAADKLAIVANLCGYGLRLNTTELERTQKSLAACMLCLAIANGDFTLLVPQIYPSVLTTPPEFPGAQDSEFSWAHSFTKHMGQAEAMSWNPYGPTSGSHAAISVRLTQGGLSLPGCLWQADERIDLTHLQVKYKDAWHRICHANKRPSSSSGKTMGRATTHLLFTIMEELVSQGHGRAANAVLNSTSNCEWRSRDRFAYSDMIESVDQFPDGLKVENRKGMFALDPSPDGRYHQCWIIDRVMEKGCLWTARLLPEGSNGPNELPHTEHNPSMNDATEVEPETSDLSPGNKAQVDALVKSDGAHAEKKQGPIKYESYNHTMMIKSMLTAMAEQIMLANDDRSDFSQKAGSSLANLAASFAFRQDTPETDPLARRAVFDVDGSTISPPLILVPYHLVFESIPRPNIRSMSVSWVVEPKTEAGAQEAVVEHGAENPYQVCRMVQGMWEFALSPSGRYVLA